MTNVLRAMNAEDADQEKYRDGEMKRIDAERRQARVHQVVTGMATVVADDLPVNRRVSRSAAHRQDRLLALDPLRSFVNAAMRTGIARTRGVLHFEEIDTIAERKGDAGKDERVTWPVTDRNAAWPMGGLYGG
jgi:hypothetical protein